MAPIGRRRGFYLFKALKRVEGTCINHNYFTHTKISQRTTVGVLAQRRRERERREREGGPGKESRRGESINITPADWT